MFSQKLWLVVIANTLLLQRCIADNALSTVKTSSGRSLYSDVESQNSNIEITPDSFSKSDSSFAASQSEISQNESSIVNTENGASLQDSSFYSSSNNVSASNSNTVASDGFISQTDSNFESSSSTTAESDTSIITTPNSTVMSTTQSSSVSTSSSSSVTSSSVSGQFLDNSEADISFPDDFPPIGSSYETKSLDSIPDFDDDSMEPNLFPGSPKSKFPPSLQLKPFMGPPNSQLPPNFPKFPNSQMNNSFKKPGPKGPYIPAGSFNSKPTPKIGTPVGPAGISPSSLPKAGDNPFNSPDISEPFPSIPNSSINSPMNSGFHEPVPADLLPNNQFPNNDLSASQPSQQPLPNLESLIDDKTTQPFDSTSLHDGSIPNDILSPNPDSLMTTSDLPHHLTDQPMLPDLTNPTNGDVTSNLPLQPINTNESLMDLPGNDFPSEFYPDTSSHIPEFQDSPTDLHPSSPYDSMVNSSGDNIPIDLHPDLDNGIPKDFYPNSENGIPGDFHPDAPSQFPELQNSPINLQPFSPDTPLPDSVHDVLNDYSSDYPITPGSSVPSTDLPLDMNSPTDTYPLSISPGSSIPSTDLSIDNNFPKEVYPSTDDITITSPYDSASDLFNDANSPFDHLQSQQPYDILKGSPDYDEDLSTPYNSYLHPDLPSPTTDEGSTSTLVSMDTNQDGFISPEEILESNNVLSSPVSPIENIDQPTIPDSAYLPPSGYDDASIPLDNKEYLNPETLSPNDELLTPFNEEFSPQQNTENYYPQKPKSSPYDQLPTPKGTLPSKPVPPYPGFNQPSLHYPGNKYPPYPSNNFPLPNRGPQFGKYPPYLPYYGNDLPGYPPMPFSSRYPFRYGTPMMPSPYDYLGNNPLFYDYPENYLQPSPLLNRPPKPDFYNTSPPFYSGNSPLNRPLYPGGSDFDSLNRPLYPGGPAFDSFNRPLNPGGPAFNSLQRPQYVPKNWSKIPTSTGSQLSPDLLLPSSPAELDSLSQNHPLLDLPTDSLLPQSPYDSSIPDSSLVQPSFPSDFNSNSPFIPDSLPSSDSQFPISDSPSVPLNLSNDSPFTTPESLPYQPLDLNTNSPLTSSDMPSLLPTPYSLDDEIFDILKQQYESTTAEYQLSNSIYPRDISVNFDTMTDAELTFNFVILGSSPAALSALKTLSDTGKSILIVERGDLPPHISKSLYYRPKILQSDYVRRIKSSAPHCNTEKILYAPNVLGEESTYDSNVWDYGVRSKYLKWGKLGKKWNWNNVIQYFTDSVDQPNTCAIPVSTEIENTKAVNTVTSIFNDAGLYRTEYEKGKRLEGLTVIPYLQENGQNIILAEKIFQQLTSCTNIQLALGTTPESIIFDNIGKAIGVIVKTPCGGTKTISILDELIIGSNPVDAVQFLYQSGIGDHERLQLMNIPTQINLPYVGKELIITPLHFGVLYLFPQGTLLTDYESDFVGKDYLFGKYGLPSALAVDYLKAALNIYESREANVVFSFRVFSKSMSERLNSYTARLTHIDPKIKDFLTNLCQEYDILLAVPQLTNVLSRGEIVIDNSNGQFEALVDTGMYKSKRDITIMQKALKVLKSIAETETFKSMNGKVVQIPVEQCGQPDFSTEYNRCSIRYLSLPNLHYCGGTIMGVSPLTSVVNEDLLVHGTKNVRIFSASVVPYGTSTDSSAVSSMIGNLGAHIISQNYSS